MDHNPMADVPELIKQLEFNSKMTDIQKELTSIKNQTTTVRLVAVPKVDYGGESNIPIYINPEHVESVRDYTVAVSGAYNPYSEIHLTSGAVIVTEMTAQEILKLLNGDVQQSQTYIQ